VRTVTVSTPKIIPSPTTLTVGGGLQVAMSATLEGSQHGGVDVTVTSSAPSLVVVSPAHLTAGQGEIQIPIANNDTFVPLIIQGLENQTGTATVTLSAPGFTSATIEVTVTTPAVQIVNLPASVSAGSANVTGWWVEVGVMNQFGTVSAQNVRGGSPGFVVTLQNGVEAVAQLGSDEPPALAQTVTKPIQPGIYYTQAIPFGTPYGLVFDPITNGVTTVLVVGPYNTVTAPGGLRTVTITP
jgi:hypothetical protein